MTYRVMLHPKAADFLKRLDEKKRDEIRKKLGVLKEKARYRKASEAFRLLVA